MANMGSMVIVDAERVREIRTFTDSSGFCCWDTRPPTKAEMMALLSELIERRAQAGEWPEQGYVTIPQGDEFKAKSEAQMHLETIDRMAAEIQRLTSNVNEWRQRCYRNESADVDAVRQSMLAEINEITADANRKRHYIGKMKTRHAELALQLRLELDNMTESNRCHVIALKRAQMKLSNMVPLIESEISDFFAGLGAPGEPESEEILQAQLSARILNVIVN